MISQTIDWTTEFNAASKLNLDISNWDYIVVQVITPTGAITFNGTNDGGAVQGTSDGSAEDATNWLAMQLLNIGAGTSATSVSASGNFKLNVGTRFFQMDGATGTRTVTKLIVYYTKIG